MSGPIMVFYSVHLNFEKLIIGPKKYPPGHAE